MLDVKEGARLRSVNDLVERVGFIGGGRIGDGGERDIFSGEARVVGGDGGGVVETSFFADVVMGLEGWELRLRRRW